MRGITRGVSRGLRRLNRLRSWILLAAAAAVVVLAPQAIAQDRLPTERFVGSLELVYRFERNMPTGVAVSQGRRVFVNFPRWGDIVPYTVAEIRGDDLVPFPNAALNEPAPEAPERTLLSVQSVVVDPLDRLWLLDTGSIEFQPTSPGGPKLICVDLTTNEILQTIVFPPEVALPTTYLNDVRFDLRRGRAGLAFVTDSSLSGPNAIIVVDLATGRSWRRLNDHPSTKAIPDFLAFVEAQPFQNRSPEGETSSVSIGADGIAISADGERLFYSPLSSRRLYGVSIDALADESLSADDVAATVEDLGPKGVADGLESDTQNRIYITDLEHNAIRRRSPDGTFETLVHDPRVLWPDTLELATDGYLYFTVNQLHRQAGFNGGADLREFPFSLLRLRVDAEPVLLRPEAAPDSPAHEAPAPRAPTGNGSEIDDAAEEPPTTSEGFPSDVIVPIIDTTDRD
ncbi:gluconolactonase [Rubidibacter lacunae KORDI 51-2]|uniref:Gluconolactonase n=2 Tax=Rubidibacter TaxID=582491 RepID=U5DGW3_9CHRO|nr:gluconolactonase [Rubidibacter lacunae KORDI 51-2]